MMREEQKHRSRTFVMRDRDLQPIGDIEYTPFRARVGGQVYELALHRVSQGAGWQLSDPISGLRISTIWGLRHSLSTPAEATGLDEARQLAQSQLDNLVAAVTAPVFNKTIESRRQQVPA